MPQLTFDYVSWHLLALLNKTVVIELIREHLLVKRASSIQREVAWLVGGGIKDSIDTTIFEHKLLQQSNYLDK